MSLHGSATCANLDNYIGYRALREAHAAELAALEARRQRIEFWAWGAALIVVAVIWGAWV